LGRGLETYDRPAVNLITRKLAANGYKFSALIDGIVDSAPFQMRRGEAPRPGAASPAKQITGVVKTSPPKGAE
jgi:hypothetical protein